MTAETILAELLECGIEPGLTPDGTGIAVPAGRLTDAQRAAILSHKPELIEAIRQVSRTTSELLTVARLAATRWGDNFEGWRVQCLAVPLRQRAELLAHLRDEQQAAHFPPGWVSFNTVTGLENASPATVLKFQQASAALDKLARSREDGHDSAC